MNGTQRARISDSFYASTMTKRDLCNKIAWLMSDIEDLKGEAYGLRCTIGSMEMEISELKAKGGDK